eukprot:bmy_13328T0
MAARAMLYGVSSLLTEHPRSHAAKGIASSRSHLVTQLEQGEEPWMPAQVDMTPATEKEAQKGPGPGCWCGVEAEAVSSEQSVYLEGVSQFRTPVAGLKTHPCDMSGPILKDLLHLTEYPRGKARQEPRTCEAHGKQFCFSTDLHQHHKQHSGEKFFRRDEGRDTVKSCRIYVPEKTYIHDEGRVDLPATSGLQHQCSQLTVHLRIPSSACECSRHGKAFTQRPNLIRHRKSMLDKGFRVQRMCCLLVQPNNYPQSEALNVGFVREPFGDAARGAARQTRDKDRRSRSSETTESDGGGAEGPASGKRLFSGSSPPSPHQTLKPPVRGACSLALSPGRGVQDGEAVVGGVLFPTDSVWSRVEEGYRRRGGYTERLEVGTGGGVTFPDVAVRFSWGEWRLLDEAQRRLYLSVMLESYALISSLGKQEIKSSDYWDYSFSTGCCCGAEEFALLPLASWERFVILIHGLDAYGDQLQNASLPSLRLAPFKRVESLLWPWTGRSHFLAPFEMDPGLFSWKLGTTGSRVPCVEGCVAEPMKAQKKGISVWAQLVGDGTSGLLPKGAILTALVLFSSGSLRQDRSDWNGRSRRRRCPRGTEADLKFGDGARGARRQARETDRHARVPQTLPPLPAPLRPESDGGGGVEEPASGKRSSSGPHRPHRPHRPLRTRLKPRVRGACSRARSPGHGAQDSEAVVGGVRFMTL